MIVQERGCVFVVLLTKFPSSMLLPIEIWLLIPLGEPFSLDDIWFHYKSLALV